MCSEGYGIYLVCVSVRPSVRPSVCLTVCMSVTKFSASTRNKAAKKRYQRVQCYIHWLDFLNGDFRISTAFKSYGVKTK